MTAVMQKILKKLDHVETMQKVLLQEWGLVEDFLFESASPRLKKEIHRARNEYHAGKAISYLTLRKELGLG